MKIQRYVKSDSYTELDDARYEENELEIKVSATVTGDADGNIDAASIRDIVNSIKHNSLEDFYLRFNVMSLREVTEIIVSVAQEEFNGELEPGEKYKLKGSVYIPYSYYYNYETETPYLDTMQIDDDYYDDLELS